ncbi:MAG: helix-turn-helix transcriptional regulator [Oscillospiraceae bacterium]|nr:helix-turn-helix transcriptional regulator [Oscillospiraceae bacterium]
MTLNQKEIGQRVAKLRLEKGLTQEQFANVLNISVSLIGKIETGNRGLSIDLTAELSEFFNVTTDYILFGKSTENYIIKQELKTIIHHLTTIENHL